MFSLSINNKIEISGGYYTQHAKIFRSSWKTKKKTKREFIPDSKISFFQNKKIINARRQYLVARGGELWKLFQKEKIKIYNVLS
jgi:hypothetical protein